MHFRYPPYGTSAENPGTLDLVRYPLFIHHSLSLIDEELREAGRVEAGMLAEETCQRESEQSAESDADD